MITEITSRDLNGTPRSVFIDDGFMQHSRPYQADEDGWIDQQLDPDDFEAIRTGQQMSQLVSLVNSLKRKNFQLEQELKRWKKASGMFGA